MSQIPKPKIIEQIDLMGIIQIRNRSETLTTTATRFGDEFEGLIVLSHGVILLRVRDDFATEEAAVAHMKEIVEACVNYMWEVEEEREREREEEEE